MKDRMDRFETKLKNMEEARTTEANGELSDKTKIALIGKDIGYINENIKEIKQSIQGFGVTFVTSLQYQDDKRASETRIERLEKTSNLWKWLSPTLAAVLGSVLTFLVLSYFQNLK